jgi:hypothetical protein
VVRKFMIGYGCNGTEVEGRKEETETDKDEKKWN